MEFRPTSSLLASLLRHAGNSTSSLDTYWLLEARLKSRCVRAIYYPAKLPSTWGRWTSRGREWPRESRPPHAYEIGPRKGMKNCWKFRRREERPSPPPPPLFSSSTLRLIKLASRSLRIGWLSKGRRRKGEEKKKKKRRNVSSRAPLNGTARTNCVILCSTRRQRHVYLSMYNVVETLICGAFQLSILIYDDRKEAFLLERIERNKKLRGPPDRSEEKENILIIQSRTLILIF